MAAGCAADGDQTAKHRELTIGNTCPVTLDPDKAQENITLSEDNLSAQTTADSTNDTVIASHGQVKGKWYYEATIEEGGDGYTAIGVAGASEQYGGIILEVAAGDIGPGCALGGYGFLRCNDGQKHESFDALKTGDVVGVAFDAEARLAYFRVNGKWLDGQDPEAGTGGFDMGGEEGAMFFPAITLATGDTLRAHFSGPFQADPPVEFNAYGNCQ